MAFFEPPPLPEPPSERERQPEWAGPPENVLPAAVPLSVLLALTDAVAVAVEGALAYPTGFGFTLVIRRRSDDDDAYAELLYDPFGFHPRRRRSEGLPPELLRFGIQFSDGRKATNLLSDFPSPSRDPEGPVLSPRGGGGGGRHWNHDFWVWPLPPAGPLAFVCEWPSEDVALTRKDVDASLIRDAAGRARVLWHEEAHEPGEGGFSVRYYDYGVAGDDD